VSITRILLFIHFRNAVDDSSTVDHCTYDKDLLLGIDDTVNKVTSEYLYNGIDLFSVGFQQPLIRRSS